MKEQKSCGQNSDGTSKIEWKESKYKTHFVFFFKSGTNTVLRLRLEEEKGGEGGGREHSKTLIYPHTSAAARRPQFARLLSGSNNQVDLPPSTAGVPPSPLTWWLAQPLPPANSVLDWSQELVDMAAFAIMLRSDSNNSSHASVDSKNFRQVPYPLQALICRFISDGKL
ncbi:hypothetical protein Cgig2_027594 [Carnegiea gigantea]|uniref:Uncharacterized protein n=1 Tax=Carnegiea gigantea TaxID=171969 RepID=A0A9Q1QDA9_9CARY|nr:hypothetical protein Cgig2_027594 [Carnegiea gigantea]